MRFLVLLSTLALACTPPLRKPESSQLVVTGTLFTGGFAARGQPIADATVTLRRASTGEALATSTTSSAGGYRVAATVPAKARVAVGVEKAGFVPTVQALSGGPYVELSQSLTLHPVTTLECIDTSCGATRVDVEWLAPPSSATAEAATFDVDLESPVRVDSPTSPLALAWVRLSGGTEGALALRIAPSQWKRLVDAVPGNGTLEVATATFDAEALTWTPGAPAPVFTESGVAVPEAALPALTRQEYAGGAVARLPVITSGFIAVTGDAPALGCLTGVARIDEKAAEGVALLASVEPQSTDAAGSFCVAAPLGTERSFVRTQYAGLPYAVLSLPPPTVAGTCGGACVDIGTVTLTSDSLRTPKLCRFNGRVIDPLGMPVANAEVVAFDDSVLGNAVTSFCGELGTRCALAAPSREDGTFTLNLPLLNSVVLTARADVVTATGDAQRSGGLRLDACPTQEVTLRLQRGVERLDVSAALAGDALTWSPPRAAARLTVTDAQGTETWSSAPPEGLTPPFTLPMTLLAGESVLVELDGVGRDGVLYVGAGSVTR